MTNASIDRAKFFFDLEGFVIGRGLLNEVEVKKANDAINNHQKDFKERKDKVRNTVNNSEVSGDGKTGRRDLSGMLGWENGDNEIFRSLLNHPKIVPYLHALVGNGYRLDHSPLVISQWEGSEGFALHGGPLETNGDFSTDLIYRCHNNKIHNSLLAMSVQLSDHDPGDGGFVVVKGSHKLNIAPPTDFMNCTDEAAFAEHVVQPITKAGDVVFFSESTIHGASSWKAKDKERRIALFRFSPPNFAYARLYSEPNDGVFQKDEMGVIGWPKEYVEGMSPAQLAVMRFPYNVRFSRPVINEENTDETKQYDRGLEKREFDKEVFHYPFY